MNILIRFTPVLLIVLAACQQPEDASPENRNTFVKFYGYTGLDIPYHVLSTADNGYMLMGNAEADSSSTMYILRINANGTEQWHIKLDSARGRSMQPLPDGSGYLFVGDRIYEKNEQIYSRMLFGEISEAALMDTISFSLQPLRRFYGVAMTIQGDSAITLVQEGYNMNNKSLYVSKININDHQPGWYQQYQLNDRGMDAGKSLHLNSSNDLVWVNSNTKIIPQNKIDSYVSVPVIKQNSEALSNDRYPGTDDPDNFYFGLDIQKSISGFAAVGTVTNVLNENGAIVFLKTSNNGVIDQNSIKTFSKTDEDRGNAIYQTSDGGFIILGTTTSTPTTGNGGTDFYLIKIDYNGNIIWDRLYGGSGNESGTSVLQTSDGGYLICGTSEINGSKFMCLIKTDANGNL